MFIFIISVGAILLLINIRSWRRIQHFTRPEADRRTFQFIPLEYCKEILNEWQTYALGDNTWQGRQGLIIAAASLVGLIFVNSRWLQFNLSLFIPVVVCSLFCIQIRVGRAMRRKYFEDTFPQLLSVVNAAVSAGNGIQQALQRCGESLDGDMGADFNRVDRRLNLGEDPERVFNDVWERYPYREFYFFVIIMLVSIQRGGQLRVLISRLSRIVNNSKNMARRKKSMTSEARTSAKIVAAIPLLFFICMKYFSPENFDFVVNDPVGRYILYYVIASELLGMLIIWGLLKRAV